MEGRQSYDQERNQRIPVIVASIQTDNYLDLIINYQNYYQISLISQFRYYIKFIMQGSILAHILEKILRIEEKLALLSQIGCEKIKISLPKIVVFGSQSSGKSSLIEKIVGINFLPRGRGIVTRRPLQINLKYTPNLDNPYAEFDEVIQNGVKRKITNFMEVRIRINMLTQTICGNIQIIDKPIILTIFSKSSLGITIVDLPGITSILPNYAHPNIYEYTRNMAQRYISNPHSIVLCVIPANQDLFTNYSFQLLQQIDAKGQRSIVCLTKIDIMNKGEDALSILKNEQLPLKCGYVGIVNDSNRDFQKKISVQQSLQLQRRFFAKDPIYSCLEEELWGTFSLVRKIGLILNRLIHTQISGLLGQMKKKQEALRQQLQKLIGVISNKQTSIDQIQKNVFKISMKLYNNKQLLNQINNLAISDFLDIILLLQFQLNQYECLIKQQQTIFQKSKNNLQQNKIRTKLKKKNKRIKFNYVFARIQNMSKTNKQINKVQRRKLSINYLAFEELIFDQNNIFHHIQLPKIQNYFLTFFNLCEQPKFSYLSFLFSCFLFQTHHHL